jgi:hypothetical protein
MVLYSRLDVRLCTQHSKPELHQQHELAFQTFYLWHELTFYTKLAAHLKQATSSVIDTEI